MSYRTYISDLALEVGDLSKATFTLSDELMFEKWLGDYIATHGGVWVARGKLVYGKRERVA